MTGSEPGSTLDGGRPHLLLNECGTCRSFFQFPPTCCTLLIAPCTHADCAWCAARFRDLDPQHGRAADDRLRAFVDLHELRACLKQRAKVFLDDVQSFQRLHQENAASAEQRRDAFARSVDQARADADRAEVRARACRRAARHRTAKPADVDWASTAHRAGFAGSCRSPCGFCLWEAHPRMHARLGGPGGVHALRCPSSALLGSRPPAKPVPICLPYAHPVHCMRARCPAMLCQRKSRKPAQVVRRCCNDRIATLEEAHSQQLERCAAACAHKPLHRHATALCQPAAAAPCMCQPGAVRMFNRADGRRRAHRSRARVSSKLAGAGLRCTRAPRVTARRPRNMLASHRMHPRRSRALPLGSSRAQTRVSRSRA